MITKEQFLTSTDGEWYNRYASFTVANATADRVINALNRIDPNLDVVNGVEGSDRSVRFDVAKGDPNMIYKLTEKLHTVGFADEMWTVNEFVAAKNGHTYDDYTAQWNNHGVSDDPNYMDAFFDVTDNKTHLRFFTGAGIIDHETEQNFAKIVKEHSPERTRQKQRSEDHVKQIADEHGFEIVQGSHLRLKDDPDFGVNLPILYEGQRNDINYLAERVIRAVDALDTYSLAVQLQTQAETKAERAAVTPEKVISFVSEANSLADSLADNFKLERDEDLHGMNARVDEWLDAKCLNVNDEFHYFRMNSPYQMTFKALHQKLDWGDWKPFELQDQLVVASMKYRRLMDREDRLTKAVNNILDVKAQHKLLTEPKKQKEKNRTLAD